MHGLVEFLVTPFSFPFMVRGAIAAALVGGLCAVVGTYVVLRGMAFFGDALAHSILPGLAVGYLTTGGGNRRTLFWWALGTAILVSFGIGTVSSKGKLREDTAIGIVFAGMFALGIALISTVRGYAVDLAHFLFGNVLGVSGGDLVLIGAFGGAVLLLVLLFYKEFLVISFDPDLAATLRLPTGFLHHLLLVMVATTVVVALKAVGVALTIAMLVIPAATSYLLTKRLPGMMAVGAVLGVLSGIAGIYLSYWTGIASGAAIVLVSVALFLVGLAVRPLMKRGSKQPAPA
jgi:manganese/iron transport system permease protein